jgi:hypothetical protein
MGGTNTEGSYSPDDAMTSPVAHSIEHGTGDTVLVPMGTTGETTSGVVVVGVGGRGSASPADARMTSGVPKLSTGAGTSVLVLMGAAGAGGSDSLIDAMILLAVLDGPDDAAGGVDGRSGVFVVGCTEFSRRSGKSIHANHLGLIPDVKIQMLKSTQSYTS